MCLAIPGKLVAISDQQQLPMGTVDYEGVTQSICLAYVPEAAIGCYVLVHAGFAIHIVDESEALRTLALWRDMVAQDTTAAPDESGACADNEGLKP